MATIGEASSLVATVIVPFMLQRAEAAYKFKQVASFVASQTSKRTKQSFKAGTIASVAHTTASVAHTTESEKAHITTSKVGTVTVGTTIDTIPMPQFSLQLLPPKR